MPPALEPSALERFGQNLTALARRGAFPPLAGQEAIAERTFQILLRQNKANPMFLDDDATWRLLVLKEVIRRMALEDVPEALNRMQTIALDIAALFSEPLPDLDEYRTDLQKYYEAQAKNLAPYGKLPDPHWQTFFKQEALSPEAESWFAPLVGMERLRAIRLEAAASQGSLILFIDNFHTIIGAGEIDTANLLVPMLARRQLQLIGACSLEEYKRYIERDAAFQRRFQEIMLPH